MIDEMMTLLESDDEAKALTRQITGHNNLLSSSELDESVTNTIEIRQVQKAEFISASIASVRDIKESLQEMKSGSPKPSARRLMILARRPFSFTHVCEVVYIAGDADETSEAELQDIMTKYNEVNCVDKLTWCETLILSRRWSS